MTEAFARSSKRRLVLGWVRRGLLALVVAVLTVVGLVYFGQHSMLYHPRPYDARYTNFLPADGVELRFNIFAGKQVAFYLPRGSGQQLPERIWVAFCGNGSLALDWTGSSRRSPQGDGSCSSLSGYGKSEGYATIASTRAAADNAIEALANTSRDQGKPRIAPVRARPFVGHGGRARFCHASFGATDRLDCRLHEFARRSRPGGRPTALVFAQ